MPAPVTTSSFVAPAFSLPTLPEQPSVTQAPDFADLLRQSVDRGVGMQIEADQNVMHAVAGGDITQVEVLSSVKKADLALRMMLQVRNKLLDAYNEIQQIRF